MVSPVSHLKCCKYWRACNIVPGAFEEMGEWGADPAIQFGSLADYSFANGLITKSLQTTLNSVSSCRTCKHERRPLGRKQCLLSLVFRAGVPDLQVHCGRVQLPGMGLCVQHCADALYGAWLALQPLLPDQEIPPAAQLPGP